MSKFQYKIVVSTGDEDSFVDDDNPLEELPPRVFTPEDVSPLFTFPPGKGLIFGMVEEDDADKEDADDEDVLEEGKGMPAEEREEGP